MPAITIKYLLGELLANWQKLVGIIALIAFGLWLHNLRVSNAQLRAENIRLELENQRHEEILALMRETATEIQTLAEQLDEREAALATDIESQNARIQRELARIRSNPPPQTYRDAVREVVDNVAELRSRP